MTAGQLIDLLGKADPDTKVYFADIYGDHGNYYSNKEITSMVWNHDEVTLTNE